MARLLATLLTTLLLWSGCAGVGSTIQSPVTNKEKITSDVIFSISSPAQNDVFGGPANIYLGRSAASGNGTQNLMVQIDVEDPADGNCIVKSYTSLGTINQPIYRRYVTECGKNSSCTYYLLAVKKETKESTNIVTYTPIEKVSIVGYHPFPNHKNPMENHNLTIDEVRTALAKTRMPVRFEINATYGADGLKSVFKEKFQDSNSMSSDLIPIGGPGFSWYKAKNGDQDFYFKAKIEPYKAGSKATIITMVSSPSTHTNNTLDYSGNIETLRKFFEEKTGEKAM